MNSVNSHTIKSLRSAKNHCIMKTLLKLFLYSIYIWGRIWDIKQTALPYQALNFPYLWNKHILQFQDCCNSYTNSYIKSVCHTAQFCIHFSISPNEFHCSFFKFQFKHNYILGGEWIDGCKKQRMTLINL